MPRKRPDSWDSTRLVTTCWLSPRAAATIGTWYIAPAIVMSGSRPEPEDVTRSTGTGPAGTGRFSFLNSACNAAMRCCTSCLSVALVGPRFEAVELSAAYGSGVPVDGLMVTEGRPWKYFRSVQYCPICSDPIA